MTFEAPAGQPVSTAAPARFAVGDAVRIQRDETVRPSRGTWPKHRGKPGFVVIVAQSAGPAGLPEYGVIETTTRPVWRREPGMEGQVAYSHEAVLWFAEHELVARNG